jgi:hypothetical protein
MKTTIIAPLLLGKSYDSEPFDKEQVLRSPSTRDPPDFIPKYSLVFDE